MTPDDDDSIELVPPDLKDRYSDFTLIGRGGMGRVLGARDNRLVRPVAIKLLPPNFGNALAVMRFQQEAKAVSKLNNPHVVQVLDFGYTEEGEPFLVMERVDGITLETGLETHGQYSAADTINFAVQLCSALEHAHNNEVVHRDLKPGNIMVLAENFVKILDFGLARILNMDESDWRLTRKGQPVGSVLYMSPEQVRGEESDERSDIYSLGLVIYKTVCGSLPFEGLSYLEIIRARLEEAPLTIPEAEGTPLERALRHELNTVVQKALSFKPEDRFASMTEFKDALLRVSDLAKQKVAAESIVPLPPPKKSHTKKIAFIAALVLLAIFAVGYRLYVQSEQAGELERKKILRQHKHEIKISDAEQRALIETRREEMIREKFEIGKEGRDHGLWTASNSVTDEDLLQLVGIPICQLSIAGNRKITTRGIENISALPLIALNCRETETSDDSVKYISKMKNLLYLDFQDSNVTDKGIMQLSKDLPLEHLDVKKLEGVTDDGLLYIIKNFPHLKLLSISGSGITKKSFRQLPQLRELKTLRCAALVLTDDDVVSISKMPLTDLDIGSNPLTDKSLATFRKMKLTRLFLDFCLTVTPDGVESLRKDMPGCVITPRARTADDKSPDKLDILKELY